MKLNKYIREAFVRAAMDDVPHVDYAQQARDLARKTAYDALPANIKAIADDPIFEGCLNRTYIALPGVFCGVRVVGHQDEWGIADNPRFALVWEQLKEMSRLAKEQDDRRKALKSKLESAAAAVTTRKALATMLPEFEKYLPADYAPAIKTLPMCANLVADFMDAGWPKEKTA